MTRVPRYWDSDVFLGFLKEETDKLARCELVLKAAQDGQTHIVTSALTLAEVCHVRGRSRLDRDVRNQIATFFEQPFITVLNVSRAIAELARDLYWDYSIEPKDAIHVATAVIHRIPLLESFDQKLLQKHGQIGTPPLTIALPGTGLQEALPFDNAD